MILILTDKKNIANAFNNYFVTIGPELAAKTPLAGAAFDKYMPDPVRNSCFLFPVTTSEIEYIIDKLNTSKSTGPFSIPTKLLKMLKCLLSPPLEYLFNYSFSIGKVPSKLKTARVIPVYKKSNRTSMSNYRPISLLSVLTKSWKS